MMLTIVCLFGVAVTLCSAVPLYGQDGGYTGYASYNPVRNHNQKTESRNQLSEGSFQESDGSEEISSFSLRPRVYNDDSYANSYNDLPYKPAYQHGYDSNAVKEDSQSTQYAKAMLYGQRTGGFKMADVYKNPQAALRSNRNRDYKDDYITHQPQPYEYGYALKDEHGNTQHKKEVNDGQGRVQGSYGFTDRNGIYRIVHYVADEEGFRPSIKTNEPGTDNKNPADVHIESDTSK